jgi:alpha-ketoglutarate-dependent taurine dioxygenase
VHLIEVVYLAIHLTLPDITFEPVPADYTSLKVHTLPHTGGDTLWSSGYEIYDLLSPAFKTLADGLVGRFAQPAFNEAAERGGFRVHPGPRGAPENVGEVLQAFHPFVRTNPVTGWKSVFGLGSHFQGIENATPRESEILKAYILELVTSSHAAQVRFRWSANDLAIWDNVSAFFGMAN